MESLVVWLGIAIFSFIVPKAGFPYSIYYSVEDVEFSELYLLKKVSSTENSYYVHLYKNKG